MRFKSRIFVAGSVLAASLTVGLVATATPDTSFDGDGKTTNGNTDNLASVAWGDGSVTAVGASGGGVRIVQYAANGAASESTGGGPAGVALFEPRGIAASGGQVVTQFAANNNSLGLVKTQGGSVVWAKSAGLGQCGNGDGEVGDVAVGPDGSIYSVAWNFLGNAPAQCDGTTVRKFNANGDLQSWGANQFEGGMHDTRLESAAIAVDGSSNVYTAGVIFNSGGDSEQVGVLRLNSAGNPVWLAPINVGTVAEYFGGGGTYGGSFGRTFAARAAADVAIDNQGRILVVGAGRRFSGGSVDGWVARLNNDGSLDGSFGGGVVPFDFGGADDFGLRVTGDAAGRVLVAGTSNGREFVARFSASGVLESGRTELTNPAGGQAFIPQSLSVGGNRAVSSGKILNGGAAFVHAAAMPGSGSGGSTPPATQLFTGTTPWRAIDTRDSGVPVTAGQPLSVQVGGVDGGAPLNAVAVAVNVTVVDPTAGGYLTAYPGNVGAPTASTINYNPGQTIANAVVVGMAPDGTINLAVGAGTAHAIVDVMGWFGPGQGFQPAAPVRAIDTRDSVAIPPNGTRTVTVAGLGGNPGPGSATAVALNITAVEAGAGGHLRAWPGAGEAPFASVLNFGTSQTVANAMVLGVDGSGQVTVGNYSNAPIHLVVDVMGTFTNGSAFHPVTPVRAHDSRNSAALGQFDQRTVKVTGLGEVPAGGVQGVIVNVTVTEPTAAGYFSAFPTGSAAPLASLLNFTPQGTIANGVVMGVGTDGSIDLLNSLGTTHAIVDVLGWF
ncbi:MAG: hypothetical protein R2755_02385 [Acidimicrobiales bacterium]